MTITIQGGKATKKRTGRVIHALPVVSWRLSSVLYISTNMVSISPVMLSWPKSAGAVIGTLAVLQPWKTTSSTVPARVVKPISGMPFKYGPHWYRQCSLRLCKP